jgi:hypothetical protein
MLLVVLLEMRNMQPQHSSSSRSNQAPQSTSPSAPVIPATPQARVPYAVERSVGETAVCLGAGMCWIRRKRLSCDPWVGQVVRMERVMREAGV